ncbi:DUF4836 family protein [Taibaiella koreensis]|uniref:DUF4836 family protein n=1 Tax=Taibaiella koreensis TaxID=1268548 RepID=UPI0013C2B652|nr:DUF4836 family protein [Taibaiella koreensis]
MTLRLVPVALCLMVFLASCSKKDDSTRYIPKDAIGVISINTGQLVQKVGLSMLSGSPMLKEMTRGAGGDTAHFDLEKTGLQYLTTVYAYAVPDMRLPSKSRFQVLLPLKDAEKFRAFLKEQFKEAKITTKDKFSFATLNPNICVGWDKETAIVAATTAQREWTEDGTMKPAADNSTLLTEEIEKTFGLQKDQSLLTNDKFTALMKAGHDIGVWMNYEALTNAMPQEELGQAGTVLASQKKLIKDAFLAGGIDFEKGKITGDARYYFNPSVKGIASALEVKSVNNDLLGKVPGSQMNLMLSHHFNPQGIRALVDTIGMLPLATTALKEINLSFDDILNAFSGDFLLAFTDFKVTTESESYTLAGSSVNYTKPVPSFKAVLSMKIKDKTAFDKLLQTVVSNGLLSPGATPNTYMIGGSMTLATDGAYVVASNEAGVATSFLQTSGNKAFNIPSEVKSNPSGFFLDVKNSINSVPLDLLYGKEDSSVFHDGKQLFESVKAYGGKLDGDHTEMHFEATFQNKDENSLLQLIRFGQKVVEAEKKMGDSVDDVLPGDQEEASPAEAADSTAVAPSI